MQTGLIDYLIIAIYLIVVASLGTLLGGKQKSVNDYFLASKNVPWWTICFSIVAAETSALTFISIPGLAYASNLNFLQVAFGYLIGRIFVAFVFLPQYYKGNLTTAYNFLEVRFGAKTRTFASFVFLLTRTAADGVRLFATAIPLYLMLNISPHYAIVIIAFVALIYVYAGGIKGVIWVDAFQMLVYLGGAVAAGIFILNLLPDGWNTVILKANAESKLSLLNFGLGSDLNSFFKQPYNLFAGIIGGAFVSMASHGADQLVVQRLLTAGNLRKAQAAVIGSGIIVVFQLALFLILGVMLFAYYGKIDIKTDEVFPLFIINVLPSGVKGLIIAALFAAALSTIAGSVSSLSSSTMLDIIIPFSKKENKGNNFLITSKLVTIMWSFLLTLSAFLFMTSSHAVVEQALSIASFTYGGLLGTFLLGIINKKAKQEDALAGFVAGILVMVSVISLNLVGWTWYTLIGVTATIFIGSLLTAFSRTTNNFQ